jgi:hypothetical protein
MKKAVIGLRAKTGRAVAVALSDSSEFICRAEVTLCDAKTRQPYHQVMDLPWSDAVAAVQPAIATIEKIAARELGHLIEAVEAQGFNVASIAVVGPADRNLERIGSPHIRAHAAEGVLFRAVIEKAAAANRRKSRAFVDPASELSATDRKRIVAMKKIAGSPWTADEKAAAMAAMAML